MSLGPLGWNLLYVRDLEVMRAFYTEVVGLRVLFEAPGVVAYDTGPCTLELMQRHDLDNPRTGWDRSPLLMSFHVDDLDTELAGLLERGAVQHSPVKFVIGVDDPKWRLVQLVDPEGNLFEIIDEPVGWIPDETP